MGGACNGKHLQGVEWIVEGMDPMAVGHNLSERAMLSLETVVAGYDTESDSGIYDQLMR